MTSLSDINISNLESGISSSTNLESGISNSTNNIGCCGIFAFGILAIMLLGIFYVFPVVQIAYGNNYAITNCSSDLPNPDVWLIINGATNIAFITSYILTVVLVSVDNFAYFFPALLLLILLGIFEFAWLIIGSVMFWRDCLHSGPKSLNTLMWISLIAGYASLFLTSQTNNKKKN